MKRDESAWKTSTFTGAIGLILRAAHTDRFPLIERRTTCLCSAASVSQLFLFAGECLAIAAGSSFLDLANTASMVDQTKRITIHSLQNMKRQSRKITMLTAYDFSMAKILDAAGIDMILVGDTVGMIIQGEATTLPVTLEDMIYHGRIVARAVERAMVVVDLPFPHGQLGVRETVASSAQILKQTGCQAVKLEGGAEQAETIAALVSAGIPVIAHVGLRPQSVHQTSGYRVQRDRDRLKRDALVAQESGAFSVLMECVPRALAAEITHELDVPTIGIGAGAECDGQVLVTHDMLGMTNGRIPSFVRQFADLNSQISSAVTEYADAIRDGSFPNEQESFQ